MKHLRTHITFPSPRRSPVAPILSSAPVTCALATALLLLPTLAAAHEGAGHGSAGQGAAGSGTIRVQSVQPNSPAAAAGLRADDVFLRLDGQEVLSYNALQDVMAKHQPGDTVTLTVERQGETVDLALKFGARPDGGVSIGIQLTVEMDPNAEGASGEGTTRCLDWIEETYRIESMMRDLELDLAADYETLRACVGRDTSRMNTANAVRYCDNVFKVHCSGVDLLAEVGDAQVRKCEATLSRSSGLDPRKDKRWTTCAQHKVFDRYSKEGVAIDAAACAAALRECGAKADVPVEPDTPSAQQHTAGETPVAWSRWGGPNQDFRAPSAGLATSWPEGGPEKLWSRVLGDGYSAILVEDGRLYTQYSTAEGLESVVCLDARTGKTVWEHRYEHGPRDRHIWQFGQGPNSTPLIDGDLLFTVGVAGRMHALEKADGKVVWTQELWDGLGGNFLIHGYSSSPVAYEDSVIVPVGGEDAGLVAFHQKDGSVKWKTDRFRNSYSSPRIMDVAGEPQLVVFMAEELIGVDPASGELRWRYPHVNQWKHNITVPAVVGGDTIFLSSPQAGARGLRLVPDGEAIRVEEVWSSRRVQFYHASSAQVGDWVYGSSGTSMAFMTAVNIRTGEVGWRQRGFAKANCVEADGKLVILDEDGMLYLASATPEELIVHAETQLLDRVAWTVPTIVGKTLYVRDTKQILALNLG